jgi:superfamily I DNA/RNA helicase
MLSLKKLRKELKWYVNKAYEKDKPTLLKDKKAVDIYLNEIPNYDYHKFKFDDKFVHLNDEQYAIVTADKLRNQRIIACAGSGKTTTILCRIKYLIDLQIEPHCILLMTFNVDAREQLFIKIKQLFGFQPNIDVCTIDSFAYRNYMKYKHTINKDYSASVSEYCNIIAKFMENNSCINKQYKYVFFDEFQDANEDQFNIIKGFAKTGCIITVIGDDAQNIYTFRGTNVAYIMNFDKYINNVDTYMLTTNYRSTPEIVTMANEIISKNGDQIKKEMKAIKKSINLKPKINIFHDQASEHKYIISDILNNLKRGVKPDDIAILSKNNEPLKWIEEELSKHNKENNDTIQFIALITDNKSDIKPKLQPNHITLTTIHKSKGLEWEIVYIIDCCDKYLPAETDDISIQEERRLFYVAVTRAKGGLIMTIAKKSFPITRFIGEISKNLYIINERTDELFYYKERENYPRDYTVTDIVKMFRASDISKMREMDIIPKYEIMT